MVKTAGTDALVRSDLEPILKELFTRSFPAVARMMAHPAEPWPYGTVIRPTRANRAFSHSTKHMVIGPGTENVLLVIGLTKTVMPEGLQPTGTIFGHLLNDITERWEPVPETEF